MVNEWKPGKEVGGVEGSQERSMKWWAVENEGWQQQQVSEWVGVYLRAHRLVVLWVAVNVVLA